jgi:copper chaperone CopZ
MGHQHGHGLLEQVTWWEWATSAVLLVALARALRIRGSARIAAWRPVADAPSTQAGDNAMDIIELEVKGMSCGHCKGTVEKALGEIDGVRMVDVSLESGRVVVYGNGLDTDGLVTTVISRGFEAKEAVVVQGACGCGGDCG